MVDLVLPENERLMVELLAQQPRINAGSGKKRLEFLLEDGRLVEAHVHDRIPVGELERSPTAIPPESVAE